MNGKQTVFVTWFCVFLLLSCLFTNIDARKYASSSNTRRTGSSSNGRTSRPSTDSKYSNSHVDQAKLSYSGYNSAPNPPRNQQPVAAPAPPPLPPAAKAPELPKSPESSKPIGWNVPDGNVQKQNVHNTNAAPNPHQTQQAPPPYSQYPAQGAAPPPYSPHSNVNSHPHDAPPPYSPQAGAPPQYSGAPVSGGYPVHNPVQQGGYSHQQGGYPAQQGGYPAQQGGYPIQQGGYPVQQGGYPVQQGGFPIQQGYPAGQYPVQPQKSSGSGLQTAVIAGIGGLALYGALKPGEEKTVIINNGVEQKPGDSSTTAAAAPVTPVTPAGETSVTPVAGSSTAPVVPITPIVGSAVTPVAQGDPTTMVAEGSAPLAPFPSPVTDAKTVTMAPPDVPPYSGSTIHYDQIPLAPFPSNTPLAPFPSSLPPMCAPGQNPDDPLFKCTPLTVAPMYVTPSTVDGAATAQKEASAIPVASNTNQNLQAQSALKSSAVSCSVVAFNIVMIPILTLLMV